MEFEAFQHLLHKSQCLFGLAGSLTESRSHRHNEQTGNPRESVGSLSRGIRKCRAAGVSDKGFYVNRYDACEIALRPQKLFLPAKILIVIREQISAIGSCY